MKLKFGGIHVLQIIKVETEDGMTELEFPSFMTREAIIRYLADIMKRKVTYSIHNDVYTIHREDEKVKLANELKEKAEKVRKTNAHKYVEEVRKAAREAAAKGKDSVDVSVHEDAMHCRELISHILSDEDGFNVKTRCIGSFTRESFFVVHVAWNEPTHHAPYHK